MYTHQHINRVVREVLTRCSQSFLIFLPVPLEEWILHEHEGPTNAREVLGYVLHYCLCTLGVCECESVSVRV